MLSKSTWARAVALTSAFAVVTAAIPAATAFAQEAPSVALEQARRGEDGTSGAGAASGNLESGSSKRDKNGNGGNASAGSAGEVATADGSSNSSGGGGGGEGAPLPENADVLEALGVLDDVTIYGLDVLTGLNIPVELLPPPAAAPAPETPSDINTGGRGTSGTSVSTEPGTGAAPAGGSSSTAAEDGAGASNTDGKKRDRANKDAEGTSGTDGGTDTATATGS